MKKISLEVLEQLKKFDTPTIANAIERFDLRGRLDGVLNQEIKCQIPLEKPMVGFACTAKVSATAPAEDLQKQKDIWMEYYKTHSECEYPSIAVIEDIDEVPVGSFWGEVNATVHKSLGCQGVITNGGVRDLNEVETLDFGYFAGCLLVSHGYIHIEEYDCEVNVGGVTIKPGDLIHADRHGAIVVPIECVNDLADACQKAADAEMPVLEGCRNSIKNNLAVNLDDLRQWREEMAVLRAKR